MGCFLWEWPYNMGCLSWWKQFSSILLCLSIWNPA
jgi:hypothetical protein